MTNVAFTPSCLRHLLTILGSSALAVLAPSCAQADDHIVLGPGAAIVSSYEGASSYRVLPIPLVDVRHGRLFLNPTDGAGIDVVSAGGFDLGASIDYVMGYRAKDAPQGIGHLADAAGARLFATYRSGGLRVEVGGTRSLGGTDGITADATVSYTAKLTPRLSIIPSIASTWANARYSQRYFGITAQQASLSGLALYQAGSGFKDVSTGLTAKYALNKHWVIALGATGRGLLGDAADSPLVRHRWQPEGSFGIAYGF